jgi:4,4'-diaponeurosporenoate glycosyltransferase
MVTLTALVLAGLGAATWLLGHVRAPRPSSGAAPRADVSVVIPARNEAAALPALLAALNRLDPAAHEIIVVDDDSEDRTAAVATAHGATVVRTAPPAGWLGKPWACHSGAAVASGNHLLFLDADTWLAPGALAALVPEHRRHGGLLSVQPHHVTASWGEELSAYPNLVAMMGSGAFAARRRSAAAFGPCLFTTAAAYRRVGGHAAVRGEVIEDLRLAQRYRRSGLAVTCLAGGDTVRFRMYPDGWSQLADGWAKNLAAGASAASTPAVAGTVLWVAAHAAVAATAPIGVLGWITGTRPLPATTLALWALIAAHQLWLLRRIGTFRPATAIAFPVPLVAFISIFARSLALTLTRRPIVWRGRAVHPRGEGST